MQFDDALRLGAGILVKTVDVLGDDRLKCTSPFEGGGEPIVPLLPSAECVAPIASIFYDAIPFHYQDIYLGGSIVRDYYFRRMKTFPLFSRNLCISGFSKSDLDSIYPGTSSVDVSAGISRDFIELGKSVNPDGQGAFGDFILYVGALDWRKNVRCIVDAIPQVDALWPENRLNVVIAGDAQGHLIDELRACWLERHLPPERLICVGHVSDEQLVSLYKAARVLVHRPGGHFLAPRGGFWRRLAQPPPGKAPLPCASNCAKPRPTSRTPQFRIRRD